MNLQDLKKEAKELGIAFSPNISAEKLSQRIDEFYTSKEEIVDPSKSSKTTEINTSKKSVSSRAERLKQAEEDARRTKIVTIVDNDQRVNNHTTTAVTSCENLHFNLGTIRLPLNTPVEVMQGHIRALEGVEIPQHVKNPKSGLTEVRLRKRYHISYEQ